VLKEEGIPLFFVLLLQSSRKIGFLLYVNPVPEGKSRLALNHSIEERYFATPTALNF